MLKPSLEHSPEEDISSERRNYFAIDALKAFAIALVVLDHSLTWDLKHAIGGPLWERISIPFFLIVMGFNMGLSFRRSGGTTLRELYSWSYFKKKFIRYVAPFIVLYAALWLLGLYFNSIYFSEYSLLLLPPFSGPGDWFIPVLFTSILVFPLVYKGYTIRPKLTVSLCFISELLLGVFLFFNAPQVWNGVAYTYTSSTVAFMVSAIRLNILFYLPAVGLGLWFSSDFDIKSKHNLFMWIAFPLSLAYTFAYQFLDYRVLVADATTIRRLIWGDYTFLMYPYVALFFLLAMKYLPADVTGRVSRHIAMIGKASYHILLFQIFYFSIWYHFFDIQSIGFPTPLHHLAFYSLNLPVCLAGGLGWYHLERRATTETRSWWDHPWMMRGRYFGLAGLSLFMMTVVVEIASFFTGLTNWAENNIPYFVLNEDTGPGVMLNISIIIIFLGLCMYFIYKAFESGEEPIPV
ncbi:MAG: acyltransferase [Candidatus Thorarchaeota archaeon]|nr:acyltransferase [Candidatus Thorarchaeota archaeon]